MANLTKEQREVLRRPVVKKGSLIAKALKSIEATRGILTPQAVVEEAAQLDHPLHGNFEWDDSKAGERYRWMQARTLINSIRVEFEGESREAYLNVVTRVQNVPTRGYVSIEKIISDEDMHKQVVRDAIREVKYWEKKFQSLSDLKGVINTKKLKEVEEKYSEKESE